MGRCGANLGSTPPFGKRLREIDQPCPNAQKPRPAGLGLLLGCWWSAVSTDRRGQPGGQAAFLSALVKLSFIGSTVSVATFCAVSARSLACTVNASNCLRMKLEESSTTSA